MIYLAAAVSMCCLLLFAGLFTTQAQEDAPVGAKATATYTPLPPSATPTPAATPTPDPTLIHEINNLAPIDAVNLTDLTPFYEWTAHSAPISSTLFTASGNLVSSALNATMDMPAMRLWHITNENIIPDSHAFEEIANMAAVDMRQVQQSEDGQFLTASYSIFSGVWDAQTGQAVEKVDVLWSASTYTYRSGGFIVVGGSNGVVSVWASNSGRPQLYSAFQINDAISQVAQAAPYIFVLTQSGRLLMTEAQNYGYGYYGDNSIVTVIQEPSEQEPSEDEAIPISSSGSLLMFDRNQQHVIYAASHQDVHVYDYAHQQTVRRLSLGVEVGCLTEDTQNSLLIVGDKDGVLHFYDTYDYELIEQINTQQPVTACALSPDQTMLVVGHPDGTLTLWGIT